MTPIAVSCTVDGLQIPDTIHTPNMVLEKPGDLIAYKAEAFGKPVKIPTWLRDDEVRPDL